ncbi:MAG: manganese efflux pump MntP family protein [Treponemataceae bacterium]|nr:manganese efflux pump MntP family protein [Treponemataceae bacterium]
MNFSVIFFLNSILLGVGLAMDAFSVSIANTLNEPEMKNQKLIFIALTFAFFQFAMPMIGWVCVHTIVEYFKVFQKFIPWIALLLLGFIGGKMLIEGIIEKKNFKKGKSDENTELAESGASTLTFATLMLQGIATSIDALSVGFTIAEYNWIMAIVASTIIAVVTFGICICGLKIGKIIGKRFSSSAQIAGGIILIGIGLEIFIKNLIQGSAI